MNDTANTTTLTAAEIAELCNTSELHLAAARGDVKEVGRLLGEGAPPDEYDWHGVTPLFLAAAEGFYEVCELLLAHGADPKKVCGRAGNVASNPADIAHRAFHAEVFRLLTGDPPPGGAGAIRDTRKAKFFLGDVVTVRSQPGWGRHVVVSKNAIYYTLRRLSDGKEYVAYANELLREGEDVPTPPRDEDKRPVPHGAWVDGYEIRHTSR